MSGLAYQGRAKAKLTGVIDLLQRFSRLVETIATGYSDRLNWQTAVRKALGPARNL